MIETAIEFPHLGIYLDNVPKNFTIFGFTIALYGVVIAVGMGAGLFLALIPGDLSKRCLRTASCQQQRRAFDSAVGNSAMDGKLFRPHACQCYVEIMKKNLRLMWI